MSLVKRVVDCNVVMCMRDNKCKQVPIFISIPSHTGLNTLRKTARYLHNLKYTCFLYYSIRFHSFRTSAGCIIGAIKLM